MISTNEAAALQAQIDQLKQELNRSKFGTPAMNVSAPSDVAPDLSQDVNELMKWKSAVEKAEASDAAKAALKPSTKIGGRIFIDSAVFGQNSESFAQAGDAQDAVKVRNAWVEMSGKVMENTQYRLWFNLSSQVSVLDCYVDFGELPYIQNLRVGNYFEPFSLEQLTANKYLAEMERSSPFLLGRNLGVMAHSDNGDANWTYGVGLFTTNQSSKPPIYQSDNDASAITGRLTYLPWYDEASDGRGLIHLGIDYSWRHLGNGQARFRSRPDSALAPYIVDTGVINGNYYSQAGFEFAYVYGSFRLQSEYQFATVNTTNYGAETFDTYYVGATYFLTGEYRPYNRRSGSFSNRVVPFENFFRVRTGDYGICNGWGAWELAYRYAHDDLNSANIKGGQDHRHLFGLNWYLSPYTRAMFEYVYSNTDDQVASNGVLQIFQMRMQIDF